MLTKIQLRYFMLKTTQNKKYRQKRHLKNFKGISALKFIIL